jgi:type IV pilus assembly protein PilQ
VIEKLLSSPELAAPQATAPSAKSSLPRSFQTRTIVTDEVLYTGRRISLNLVDADVKQVFRLFHEISGLNFVLDPAVNGRVTIVLDQVPWDQALDIILKNNGLDKVLENNVLRIASTQKLAQEAAARRQLRDAQELEVEPITLTRTLSYAKATDVERVIQNGGILSPRGTVIVDERTNTVIVSDVPKKVEPIDSLISSLDSETPQVMIEARIVETSKSFVRDLGVTWGVEAAASAAHGTSTGLAFPHNATARYGLNLPGGGAASQLAFSLSNIVDSFTLDLALNALESQGEARILSSPKIATQNNERAEIEQGVRIPVVNTTATEINVEFVSASLRLVVTPQITAEGTIILDVEVENNSPDFVNTSGDVPSIRTQRAQTKVLINDGGTTVIGGIFTVNEGQSEVGVPWFRKIPVFGWLFRSQNITSENRELLIFITPKIIRLT